MNFRTRITAEFINGSLAGWPAPLLVITTANTAELGNVARALTQPDGNSISARRLIIEADPETMYPQASITDDDPFTWCDACRSYHHPLNTTCRLWTGAQSPTDPQSECN